MASTRRAPSGPVDAPVTRTTRGPARAARGAKTRPMSVERDRRGERDDDRGDKERPHGTVDAAGRRRPNAERADREPRVLHQTRGEEPRGEGRRALQHERRGGRRSVGGKGRLCTDTRASRAGDCAARQRSASGPRRMTRRGVVLVRGDGSDPRFSSSEFRPHSSAPRSRGRGCPPGSSSEERARWRATQSRRSPRRRPFAPASPPRRRGTRPRVRPLLVRRRRARSSAIGPGRDRRTPP